MFKSVREGEEASDLTLGTDDGRGVSLGDYQSTKVVFYFYPKDGTPGCTIEAIKFRYIANESEMEGAFICALLVEPD